MATKQDAFYEIIKYNPAREYIGEWTPNNLYNRYNRSRKDPTRPVMFVQTGRLSATMACDAIWNEMLYNPVRFGDKNPFEFDGQTSIVKFCEKYPSFDDKNSNVLFNISYKLRGFLYFIGESNPEFYAKNEINDYSILITCDDNRKANDGYRALACLVRCVRLVAQQNMKDYRNKRYREQMQQTIKQRHPNLTRLNQHLNFVEIDRIKQQKEDLREQIHNKNNEIYDTSIRIKTLNEYDPPVDSSNERNLLKQQTADLQKLEEKYEYMKKRFDYMISPQKTY